MIPEQRTKVINTLKHAQAMIDLQKSFSEAKRLGEHAKAREMGNHFVLLRDKVELEIQECNYFLLRPEQGTLL